MQPIKSILDAKLSYKIFIYYVRHRECCSPKKEKRNPTQSLKPHQLFSKVNYRLTGDIQNLLPHYKIYPKNPSWEKYTPHQHKRTCQDGQIFLEFFKYKRLQEPIWKPKGRFSQGQSRKKLHPLLIWTALFWVACPVMPFFRQKNSGLSSYTKAKKCPIFWPVQLC